MKTFFLVGDRREELQYHRFVDDYTAVLIRNHAQSDESKRHCHESNNHESVRASSFVRLLVIPHQERGFLIIVRVSPGESAPR